ncbi:MAG: HIT domain-containing protein [Perlucidibaca sp.]
MFSLHSRLAADTITLGDFPLCRCLLMNDAQYPWLILVPRRADLREVHELSEADQVQLLRESSWVSQRLASQLGAIKMNVANLGNVVSQLHWHIIARYEGDPAWPGPVWGKLPAVPYSDEELMETLNLLKAALPHDGAVGLNWAV